MTITTIFLAIFGALLIGAHALWELGADRVVVNFGRLVVRTITFGRTRIAEDADETMAMAICAATFLVFFPIGCLYRFALAMTRARSHPLRSAISLGPPAA